jgi:hypothetical protein
MNLALDALLSQNPAALGDKPLGSGDNDYDSLALQVDVRPASLHRLLLNSVISTASPFK